MSHTFRKPGLTLDIKDFSIEQLGAHNYRVLYKGNSWFHDHSGVLPQAERCYTRKGAIRKARRLAKGRLERNIQPVTWTDHEMKIPTTDMRTMA